jgi:4-hydroxymandelate oxidase
MKISRREALLSAGVLAAAGAMPAGASRTDHSEGPDRAKCTDRNVGATGAGDDARAVQAAQTDSKIGPEMASLGDFEEMAKTKIPHTAWEFFNGAAADEITMRWNKEAYQKIRLKPRILVDVSKLDTRVTLFGQEHAFPILLAPTAYHKLAHPEGELATARGAGAADVTMVVSTVSTTSIEDIAGVAKSPLWFQLYVQEDRGFTKSLVQRAEAAGCKAICLTVDTPILGARNREQRAGFGSAGLERPNLKGLKINGVDASTGTEGHAPVGGGIYSAMMDPKLTWKDVEWLKSFMKVPLLLKGVLNPDDADHAVKAGASGIMVSNHGARNLDTVPATIDVLPMVVEKVAGRVPVIVDGGVRRGTDVLKAIALGANAVMIGRPYVYGLGVAGGDGVAAVVHILRREFEMAMALMGRPTIGSIDRSVLWG